MPDLAAPRQQAIAARWPAVLLVLVVLLAAAAIRLRTLGDVVAHGDEQFYLLVGDRIANHGALAYVDIWDRKPVGLFLIYAAIRLLGGEGIVQYQLVATLVAGATAAMIALWVRRAAGMVGALIAALLYLLILQTHLGFGGQAELFVNLLIVGAGWIVFTLLRADGARALLLGGAAAMLLVGLAIQVKPTAVVPGFWLGLALLWLALRRGARPGELALGAALWIGAALLPTLLAMGWYWAIGQLDAWWFANVGSILAKGGGGSEGASGRLAGTLVRLGLPFGASIALLGIAVARRRHAPLRTQEFVFLVVWFVFGVFAFLMLPAAYPHYALIAAPMGCLLLGHATAVRPLGWAIALGALLFGGRMLMNEQERIERVRALGPGIEAMAAAIRPQLQGGGCLYVHGGPVVLYMLANSCLPTRWPFPDHFSTAAETTGLGVEPATEVARILAERPPVIVTGAKRFHSANAETQALVDAAIARSYRPLAVINDETGRPLISAYALSR